MSLVAGWLTHAEAAARVERSERTIRSWIKDGLKERVGLIREEDLLEFDKRKRDARGRPVKPGSILKRFVGGDYAEVFAALSDAERATLADELIEVADFLAARSD